MPNPGTTRPTGRELRLVNDAIALVTLLETSLGITLSDSARARLRDLREACESYVDPSMRSIPVRVTNHG